MDMTRVWTCVNLEWFTPNLCHLSFGAQWPSLSTNSFMALSNSANGGLQASLRVAKDYYEWLWTTSRT